MTAEHEIWFARGVRLQQNGALEESVAAYREALRVRPVFPEALSNVAAALRSSRVSLRRSTISRPHSCSSNATPRRVPRMRSSRG